MTLQQSLNLLPRIVYVVLIFERHGNVTQTFTPKTPKRSRR